MLLLLESETLEPVRISSKSLVLLPPSTVQVLMIRWEPVEPVTYLMKLCHTQNNSFMARQVKKGREGRPRKYSSWCYRVEHHFLKFNALSNYPNRTTTPIPNALVYFEPQSRSSYYNLKYPSHFRATRNWRLLKRGKSKGVDRLEKIML